MKRLEADVVRSSEPGRQNAFNDWNAAAIITTVTWQIETHSTLNLTSQISPPLNPFSPVSDELNKGPIKNTLVVKKFIDTRHEHNVVLNFKPFPPLLFFCYGVIELSFRKSLHFHRCSRQNHFSSVQSTGFLALACFFSVFLMELKSELWEKHSKTLIIATFSHLIGNLICV